jgi:hypothetical protein
VNRESLEIGDHCYQLDVPTWAPRLPAAASLLRARERTRHWLPDLGVGLELGRTCPPGLPAGALAALRRGDLPSFAAAVGGRGPGLTPAGDDALAGVLLVARAIGSVSPVRPGTLRHCAHRAQTSDIARAFLACAAEGRCIEPAHDLLAGLASADHGVVSSAVQELNRFGSSSGAALMYGIRTALLELPTAVRGTSRSLDRVDLVTRIV